MMKIIHHDEIKREHQRGLKDEKELKKLASRCAIY
jgi:hypothetical protein